MTDLKQLIPSNITIVGYFSVALPNNSIFLTWIVLSICIGRAVATFQYSHSSLIILPASHQCLDEEMIGRSLQFLAGGWCSGVALLSLLTAVPFLSDTHVLFLKLWEIVALKFLRSPEMRKRLPFSSSAHTPPSAATSSLTKWGTDVTNLFQSEHFLLDYVQEDTLKKTC